MKRMALKWFYRRLGQKKNKVGVITKILSLKIMDKHLIAFIFDFTQNKIYNNNKIHKNLT